MATKKTAAPSKRARVSKKPGGTLVQSAEEAGKKPPRSKPGKLGSAEQSLVLAFSHVAQATSILASLLTGADDGKPSKGGVSVSNPPRFTGATCGKGC